MVRKEGPIKSSYFVLASPWTTCAASFSVFLAILLWFRIPNIQLPPRNAWRNEAVQNISNWQSSLFRRAMQLQKETEGGLSAEERELGVQVQPIGHSRFDLFSPFVTCPEGGEPLLRVGGDGDGSKILCLSVLYKHKPCVVYSMGSNSDYAFEADILRISSCQVVTFDCTVDGKTLDKRHKFIRKCIGTEKHASRDASSWWTLEKAMEELNHKHITLLKIDIEGAEYDVLSSLTNHQKASLPAQIAVEVHYNNLYLGTESFNNSNDFSNLLWPKHQVTLSDLALFVSHLVNAGYGIVSREDNMECVHCTELTLLKVI